MILRKVLLGIDADGREGQTHTAAMLWGPAIHGPTNTNLIGCTIYRRGRADETIGSVAPESLTEIEMTEELVGRRLPDDYREFMLTRGAMEEFFPNAYVQIWDLAAVREVWRTRSSYEPNEGLIVIGSDGASELIGFDTRQEAPPVVLVNVVSAGWHEACFQARTFAEFLSDVASDGFKFVSGLC